MNFLGKIPGQAYLWIAVTLFAASNSIVRKLTEIGSQHLVAGRNPISLCNVLFVGNLCALLVFIPIYYRQLNLHSLREIHRQKWIVLITVAILSGALAPALIFQALSLTMVTNVILIGRIEPPLILGLSVWILRERLNRWEIAGALVSLIGVGIIVFLQNPGGNPLSMDLPIALGKGEILTILGVSSGAIATVISKARLEQIPLGIFTIIRTTIGTIVFFFLALVLYGKHHFADAFSPFLWQWMLLYGTAIVAVGQMCLFRGLRASTISETSLANSFSPIAGILAAYLLLNEKLTLAHYIGGSVIIIGLFLSQIGIRRKTSSKKRFNKLSSVKEMEAGLGFKGF